MSVMSNQSQLSYSTIVPLQSSLRWLNVSALLLKVLLLLLAISTVLSPVPVAAAAPLLTTSYALKVEPFKPPSTNGTMKWSNVFTTSVFTTQCK
jgi:hypothetical protein